MIDERDRPAAMEEGRRQTFWRSMWGLWLPPLLDAVFIFWLSSLPMPPFFGPLSLNDKAKHAALYGVFTVLVFRAFAPGLRGRPALLVVATVALVSFYGATDEFHQSFVPGRSPDVLDWLADSMAALVVALGALRVR